MPNQVSGFAGYYFFLDGQQLNTTPILDGVNFIATGLASGVDYSNRLTVAPVDKAGNVGAQVPYTDAITLTATPAQSPMGATDTAAIDALVGKCIAAGAGPGVTISVSSPRGFYVQSYGAGTGNDQHFRVASQTKSFTATCVLRCVDQGLISLSAPLSTYLTGYTVDPTIEQMMMMQSGLYDYELDTTLAYEFVLFPTISTTVDQIISVIKQGAKMFDPGTSYYYTNSNYYVLAKVVEAVDPTHRTIDQIIQQDILTPLGMTETSFPVGGNTGVPAPASVGYDNNPIALLIGWVLKRNVTVQNPSFVWAAGAIISTVGDLIKWGNELRTSTLLSPASASLRMSTFHDVPVPAASRYGLDHRGPDHYSYGLGFLQVGSWYGHDGSWLGWDSCTMFEPVTQSVISIYEDFQTNGLLALVDIWFEIADYLLPGSPSNPSYGAGAAVGGSMSSSLKALQNAGTGNVYAPGFFQPFIEFNQTRTNQPIPDGATYADVTLLGAGGPAGRGISGLNYSGASGGSGGGRVNKIRIPVSEMGATYSTDWGRPGLPGQAAGGDSFFRSGGIDLTAKGGLKGNDAGGVYQTGAAGVDGGNWSATPSVIGSVTVTGAQGTSSGGSPYEQAAHSGTSDSTNDVGCGGGAGGTSSNYGGAAGVGGSAMTVPAATGASASAPNAPDPTTMDIPALHGGPGGNGANGAAAGWQVPLSPGGNGGDFGGGGGGSGSGNGSNVAAPGNGGRGGCLVEWG